MTQGISHEVPFISLALQTQQEINDSYMRKMNRDYASHIPNPRTTSITTIAVPTTPIGQTRIE